MAPKQQKIDFAFVSITREKREVEIEKEFLLWTRGWRGSSQGQSKRFSSGHTKTNGDNVVEAKGGKDEEINGHKEC